MSLVGSEGGVKRGVDVLGVVMWGEPVEEQEVELVPGKLVGGVLVWGW